MQKEFNINIIRGNVVTPTGILFGGYVEVTNDLITAVETNSAKIPSVKDRQARLAKLEGVDPKTISVTMNVMEAPWVLPGFVDIHNHGVGGCDEVCDHWLYPEFSQRYLAQCGTLSVVASVIFSSTRPDATKGVIEMLEKNIGEASNGCVIEGIHAEGPIIQDRGGLPSGESEMPLADFKHLCSSMPSLKVMTISPSKDAPKGFERIKHLLDIGVRVSLGHDRQASESDVLGALQLVSQAEEDRSATGSSKSQPSDRSDKKADNRMHSTHLFNVMHHHHRQPGLINFLMCDKLPAAEKYAGCEVPTVEVIADLIHVHPVVIQSMLSARNASDIAVISDCISSYDPGKRLKYNGRTIAVRAEGGCYLCDQHGKPSTTLAGSTVTLADQFFSLITYFRQDVATACLLLATNPARIAKIDDRVGSLTKGKKANILILSSELNTITKRMVYGKWLDMGPHRMLRPSFGHL